MGAVRQICGVLLLCAFATSMTRGVDARPYPDDAALGVLLDRAAEYVTRYANAFSSTVSEERYGQSVTRLVARGVLRPDTRVERRILVSDYLLIQIPGSSEWAPFRDVYSVDGVPIRDRSDRLLKLLLDPNASSVVRARQIREESSRYNIGDVIRDINVPTFALHVLDKELRGHFAFTRRGHERVTGVETEVIDFTETGAPTMIVGREGENVPARGRFWLEPGTGAVMRSVVETRPADMRTRIQVRYRQEPKLGILVPSEMIERHDLVGQTVDGRAVYSNYRRFRVDTAYDIK